MPPPSARNTAYRRPLHGGLFQGINHRSARSVRDEKSPSFQMNMPHGRLSRAACGAFSYRVRLSFLFNDSFRKASTAFARSRPSTPRGGCPTPLFPLTPNGVIGAEHGNKEPVPIWFLPQLPELLIAFPEAADGQDDQKGRPLVRMTTNMDNHDNCKDILDKRQSSGYMS